MKQRNEFICLVIFEMIITSCCSINQLTPPYFITEKSINVGEYENVYSFVGASILIYNNSKKNIEKMTITFNLYDEDENYVGYGTNVICTDFTGSIEPKASKKIIINLDDVLGTNVNEGVQMDFVYIKQITYSDGTVWSDPFGLFAL